MAVAGRFRAHPDVGRSPVLVTDREHDLGVSRLERAGTAHVPWCAVRGCAARFGCWFTLNGSHRLGSVWIAKRRFLNQLRGGSGRAYSKRTISSGTCGGGARTPSRSGYGASGVVLGRGLSQSFGV